jgi:plasmid stability protein
MGTLTIRKLDDRVKQALRKRAAERGVSMEEEARNILRKEVVGSGPIKKRPTVEEIMSLTKKPKEPVDQKAFTDELWSYIDEL